jgi:hypothetical protein
MSLRTVSSTEAVCLFTIKVPKAFFLHLPYQNKTNLIKFYRTELNLNQFVVLNKKGQSKPDISQQNL